MKRPHADLNSDARLEAASAWCLKLADGALLPGEQQRFEAWLGADPENRRAFEDAVGVWKAVDATSLSPRLLTLRRDALASVERANRARWRRPHRAPWISAIAASLVLAVAGAWLWSSLSPTTYRTGVGERRVVVLSDGSKVSLDAATQVKVRYAANARNLWLDRGRAKFDVAKDARRPFTVAAADKLVRATGTAFSVELVQGQVQVVLYEGHVAVLSTRQGAPPTPLILRAPTAASTTGPVEADEVLTPGRQLVAPLEVATATVAPVDPVRSLAWEGGQLVFEGEPLASAVERVNRYSDEKIRIGDPAAGAVRIDGVFTAGDTEAFLEGVTEVFPIRARATAEGRVLVSRR